MSRTLFALGLLLGVILAAWRVAGTWEWPLLGSLIAAFVLLGCGVAAPMSATHEWTSPDTTGPYAPPPGACRPRLEARWGNALIEPHERTSS
jgi:hypothetical protein